MSNKPPSPRSLALSLTAAALLVTAFASLGCANRSQQSTWDSRSPSRQQALAAVIEMPAADTHEVRDLSWRDEARTREVLARLYLPAAAHVQDSAPLGASSGASSGAQAHRQPAPLVVFSHGIGGSREGYSYIGKYLAAQGFAALHVQHVGSDRSLWFGNPVGMVFRLQNAARDAEAIDRAKDISFALTQVLQNAQIAPRLDAQRIAAAGHSYGANTTLLVSGAQVQRAGSAIDLRDARIKAAIVISAPPFYGESDPKAILGGIQVPSLHITATGDEIKIPGYYSAATDRVQVYEATGATGASKLLAVFKEGSHSMFTDRLGTGGAQLNPQVKAASRELMLAFLNKVFAGSADALAQWPARHQNLVARFDRRD